MITYGTVYIISLHFNKALEFYRKLFERDVISQNKTRFACFQIDGFGLAIMNGYYDVEHPEDIIRRGGEVNGVLMMIWCELPRAEVQEKS